MIMVDLTGTDARIIANLEGLDVNSSKDDIEYAVTLAIDHITFLRDLSNMKQATIDETIKTLEEINASAKAIINPPVGAAVKRVKS